MNSFQFTTDEIKMAISNALSENDLPEEEREAIRWRFEQTISEQKDASAIPYTAQINPELISSLAPSITSSLVNTLHNNLSKSCLLEEIFQFTSQEIKMAIENALIDCGLSSEQMEDGKLYLGRIIYGESDMDNTDANNCDLNTEQLALLATSARNSLVNALSKRHDEAGIFVDDSQQEKSFQCTQCFGAANNQPAPGNNDLPGPKEKKGRFYCSLCPFSTTNGTRFNAHLNTHSNKRSYKCNLCSYACITNCDFQRHMRTHTGEKPYKCSECSYASAYKFINRFSQEMPAYTEETFFNIRNKCSQEQWTQYATEILEFDSYPALSDVCRDPKFANSADYSTSRRVSRMDNGVAVTQNSVLDEMSSNMDMGKTYEIFPQGSGKTSKRGSIVSEKDREKFRSSFVMQANEGSSDDEFIPVEKLSISRHNVSTTDQVPKADSNEQPVLAGPSTSNGSNSNQRQEDQHLPAYDVGMDHEHKLQEMEDLMSTLNNADEMLCSILKKIDDALAPKDT